MEWLKQKYPNGVKVASITFNNDFGQTYVKGFKHYIQGTNIQLVADFEHDPTAPNIDNQYTSAAASGADVLLLQTTGTYCTQGMADVEKGSWHPTVILSGTCASKNQFFKPLIDQGLTGKDTYTILGGKDPLDPALANDPLIVAYKDVMTKAGLDPNKSTYFTGWVYAWYTVEILKEAASYRGGLNRANIILAAHAIQQASPFLFPGMTSKLRRPEGRLSRRGRPDVPVHGQRPEAAGHVRTQRAADQPRGEARHLQDRHRRGRLTVMPPGRSMRSVAPSTSN